MFVKAETAPQRAFLVDYIARRNDLTAAALVGSMPYTVFAVTSCGKPRGAVLYINYRGASVEVAVAGETGWITRNNVREFFAYAFVALQVRRVTAIVHHANKRSRDLVERLGFKLEGVCRDGFDDGDACVYGVIRSECKWIEGPHGKISTVSARPRENGAGASDNEQRDGRCTEGPRLR